MKMIAKQQIVLIAVILGLVGFCAPVFVLDHFEFSSNFSTSTKQYFVEHPPTMIWFLLIMIKMSLYGLFLAPILYLYNDLFNQFPRGGMNHFGKFSWSRYKIKILILPALILIIAGLMRGFVISHLGNDKHFFDTIKNGPQALIDPSRYKWIETTSGVVITILSAGLMLLTSVINSSISLPDNKYGVNKLLETKIDKLNKQLDIAMMITGIVIGFSSLARSQLREVYFSYPGSIWTEYPIQLIYVNGIINTFIIAMIYVPIKLDMIRRRKDLLASIPNDTEKGVTSLGTVKFINDFFKSLKILIPLFAPFWSSFLPLILN